MSLHAAVVLPSLHSQEAHDFLTATLSLPLKIAPLPHVCAQIAELTAQRAADAAEVRTIAMAVMLRGEVFVAPGHEPESAELWRESWLAGLWAKEIARERRKHVESAFLAALMHRTGAALALKILSGFEMQQRTVMDAQTFAQLVLEFEPKFAMLLMQQWQLPNDVQAAVSQWREGRKSSHGDLACTVNLAHLLATHTMHPQLLSEEVVVEDPLFEQLGVPADGRRELLAKREQVRGLAGI